MLNFNKLINTLEHVEPVSFNGKVIQMAGLIIEGSGPNVSVGSICEIYPNGRGSYIEAEVVGFKVNSILLMPLGDTMGIAPGSLIVAKNRGASIRVSEKLLGRIIDGCGEPLDGMDKIEEGVEQPVYAEPLNPMKRRLIDTPVDLGIKSINAFLTCGKGQRIGILAGTGIGKSVLLGMIARNTMADVNVIALIGERGKEVREFIEDSLGEEGLKRSVVVVATSDQPPLIRTRGAFIATAMAEYFRSRGKNVILMMDSITRFAMAQREIGLAVGEPPTTKGYTPSVFSLLPRLLERTGLGAGEGSITGLYSVLVEGDDLADPISDATRSILDGHIVLSRNLANSNHYPAIDILNSISRAMINVVSPEHMKDAGLIKEIMATYKEAEDLINIGAYVKGSNPAIDRAIFMINQINNLLRQDIREKIDFVNSVSSLGQLAEKARAFKHV